MGTPATLTRKESKFSRMLTITSEQIENALQDVNNFLDVTQTHERITDALEEPDQVVTTEPALHPVHESKTETALHQLEKDNKAAAQLGATMLDTNKVIFGDKVCFFLGVVNVALIGFWVGKWPQTYFHFWAFKSLTLFTLRYFSYRKRGMHWMMLELCYACNGVGFYHLYFQPQSALWRKISFAFMSGPLMWSIVAMRNSLVFHDFDKMTTLMMHASPAISAWTLRWYPEPAVTAKMTPAELNDYNTATWTEMIVYPYLGYLAWVTMYYFITFVLFKKRLERKGYPNMMTLMVHEPAKKKGGKIGGLPGLVLGFPPVLQPIVYLSLHGFLCCLALLPTKLWFDSMTLHTLVLMGCLAQGVWNGAGFYFKVFAKRYISELEHRSTSKVDGVKKE